MIKKKYKVLDLFCGPGGFSTGFEAAGFEIIDAFDKDKWAVETFSENHRVKAKVTDLKTFDMALMPDADIIIGGPPCTQFSSAKSNKTRNPTKSRTYCRGLWSSSEAKALLNRQFSTT